MPMPTKESQREYNRRWIAGRRTSFFSGKCCDSCGSLDRLELHHVDRANKVSHAIWSWRKTKQLEELAKCQVLCKVCHKLETRKQFGYKQYTHGTTTCYTEMPCRCNLCKAASADYKREWRKQRGKVLQ